VSLRDVRMSFKDLWTKMGGWLRAQRISRAEYKPDVNGQGLIFEQEKSQQAAGEVAEGGSAVSVRGQGMVKSGEQGRAQEPIEKLQDGFNKLISELQGINRHLEEQAAHHAELMGRIERLPRLLESFPGVVENQKKSAEALLRELERSAAKDQQFVDAVEKIPNETAKQTDALVNINHQLAAAADTDVQMTESFNKFGETVGRLNQTVAAQSDSIMQMRRTFATSDRYLKYLITKQNRRFMWIFFAALGVCAAVILIFTGVIIFLKE